MGPYKVAFPGVEEDGAALLEELQVVVQAWLCVASVLTSCRAMHSM